jgi:predicted adenine nucleotide alpha hydrolase (AANH) superfamily ATPase
VTIQNPNIKPTNQHQMSKKTQNKIIEMYDINNDYLMIVMTLMMK